MAGGFGMTAIASQRVAPASDYQFAWQDRCQPQRVLVVDEHELVQAGLRAVLASEPWVTSCLGASSTETAWQLARRRRPQLALVSASLGGRSGFELCLLLKNWMPLVKVVLMSEKVPVSATVALKYGAVGSLPKHMPAAAIVTALKRVAEGERVFPKCPAAAAPQLSVRELQVLQHLVYGLNNPEMAALLNLSRCTQTRGSRAITAAQTPVPRQYRQIEAR
ncbi:response regulator transcription factor [Mycobacterium sp. CBMA361]|nr:response regulator transcription factor [Mycolicibacterium sp. CBMA 361]